MSPRVFIGIEHPGFGQYTQEVSTTRAMFSLKRWYFESESSGTIADIIDAFISRLQSTAGHMIFTTLPSAIFFTR